MIAIAAKRVLYVEDNEDTASAVKIILNMAGFDVIVAYNGEEGIKKAFDEKFDIIMLDIMLPDMSGWDIFSVLKNKVRTTYVFLSAIPVSEERMCRLKEEGVADYITKPFTKKDLIERITRVTTTNTL